MPRSQKRQMNNPVFSLLSLAARGRNLVSGEFSVEKAIKEHKASIVILATDASDNTKKKFTDSCAFYNVRVYIFGTKDELGHAIGCMERASIAVIDKGLADSIAAKIELLSET